MFRLIALALALLFPTFAADTIPQQQARLNKVLFRVQRQFGLEDWQILMEVKRQADAREKGVWGDCWVDDDGAHVESVALQDYAASRPPRAARKFQNNVLQHEMMHLLLTREGMPHEAQDLAIRTLQPFMKKP